jgi:hypothetical protein
MAKKLNMQFSGTIGPLVGCQRYGTYYYRGRPASVQQTMATKKSAGRFGIASKAGKVMRSYLAKSIPNAKDLHMQRRLQNAIAAWLQLDIALPPKPTADIPFVNRFNFNPEIPLEEKLKIAIDFEQGGPGCTLLRIPAFVPVKQVKAPAGTTHLQFCISTAALRLSDDNCFGNHDCILTIPYNDALQPVQQITLPLQTMPGNLLIAALQIRFGILQSADINYRKLAAKSTAAIVGAVYL